MAQANKLLRRSVTWPILQLPRPISTSVRLECAVDIENELCSKLGSLDADPQNDLQELVGYSDGGGAYRVHDPLLIDCVFVTSQELQRSLAQSSGSVSTERLLDGGEADEWLKEVLPSY